MKDDQFAIQALTALAKAYQAARNTRYLDSFAVAIQVRFAIELNFISIAS